LDKTANTFGHKRDEFVVHPGRFVRLDTEHKALAKNFDAAAAKKQETSDAAGANDQPLGKLSKAQIEKGDAVLDNVDALIKAGESDQAAKNKLAGLSAQYYTMIPHDFGFKKPPVLNTPELLGAEKALLQFYLRMGFEDIGEDDEKLTPIGGVMQLALPKTLAEASSLVCKASDIKSCMTKGTVMHGKKAGKPMKPMTPDLYGSLLLYTSNAIYAVLNKALRDEDRKSVQKFFPFLRMLFEACDRLPKKKRTLWRGIGVNLFDKYKVGSTIVWWGVSSCTEDQKVAQNFMNGCGGGATFLTLETETGCDISEVSFFANEKETILLPGTQLEVLSSEKTGANKSKIRLREVGRLVA